jgi:hydrogenase nickel incorporation protein HypB
MQVPVVSKILKANDQVALENRSIFDDAGMHVLNVMASPGAGKTSFILATTGALRGSVRCGVIEGDVASSIDADRIAEEGIPVVQINTGGSCHLDAPMVRSALPHLPMDDIDLLFIENVGNLICPTSYALGADLAVVIASVPEGHDKPFKYPGIFAKADVILLNKWDMAEVFEFDRVMFERGVRMVNDSVPIIPISCRTGEGVDAWIGWLNDRLAAMAAGGEAAAPAGAGT